MSMRILVLGSGGREHALAWRLAADPGVDVRVAPGNEFIAAELPCVPVRDTDPAAVVALARTERADLVVVGPEAPLAAGVADALEAEGFAVYGPTRAAAALESSKAFAKDVMRAGHVATPGAEVVTTAAEAERALARLGAPYVIKADGLAAGKGVLVTRDRSSAVEFAVSCLEHGRFGAAGARVLIEEFAEGPEVSVMAVCDGERFLLLPPARDHKRALDGDRGPNTGGMGAFAPVSGIDPAFERTLGDTVFAPALAEMASRGTPFRGTLFAGLVLTAKGPRVLEFNARFGDPETEAVMPLLEGRFAELLASAARGNLEAQAITRRGGASVAVALVDERYPDPAAEPGWIEGLESIVDQDVRVFGAALARANPAWRIAGGRAAYVVARGADLAVARARAYAAVRSLRGRGFRFRTDIALPAAGPAGGADSMSHATHGSFR